MYRQASVAGTFYPSDAASLSRFFSANLSDRPKVKACGVLVPHAGYVYSGATAVRTLSSVEIPQNVILLGPNHTGMGERISVYPEGAWESPFGDVPVDDAVVSKLCADASFKRDTRAHQNEHSLEVIIPILKFLQPNLNVTCVTMKYLSMPEIKHAAEIIHECAPDALLVVSSDFNHFEPSDVTERKDRAAIEKIVSMDCDGLYNTVAAMKISMCGVVPACVALEYFRLIGGVEPHLLEHTHSGLVNGDNASVVGYAGLYFAGKQ
jgi:AmmeMemoRadiSam system protein B